MRKSTTADSFSARLLLALNALNFSRGQLSAAVGVDKSLISRWLSGQVMPTSYNLARISDVLAKLKPGFNVTLWKVPRADFEAFVGVSPPVSTAPRMQAASGGKQGGANSISTATKNPARLSIGWMVTAGGAAAIFILAVFIWVLWAGRGERAATAPIPHPQSKTAALPASIAVLPFLNLSGDPAKEYLSDGISEEILNDLANTPNLRVAARTSSFSFKDKSADIAEVARKLHVRAVLEGSVRLQGNRVRIVAQLIDTADDFHLWSASYDRSLADIFAVQNEIARAIVAALTHKLLPPRRPVRAIDPGAYREFLEAQFFFNQRTEAADRKADALLKGVVARQPGFAAALALRGHVLMLLAGTDTRLRAESQELTARALFLDPNNQEALDTDLQRATRGWDWNAAERDAHRLRSINKNSATTHNGLAFFYQAMGLPEDGLKARRQAVALNPLSFPDRRNYALSLAHTGRLPEAIAVLQAALELEPHSPILLADLCSFNARAGELQAARSYAAELAAQHAGEGFADYCGIELALRSKGRLQQLELIGEAGRNNPDWKASDIGAFYARANDLGEAMQWFYRAYDRREEWLIWIRFDAATPKALLRSPEWTELWRRPLLRDWQVQRERVAAELGRS